MISSCQMRTHRDPITTTLRECMCTGGKQQNSGRLKCTLICRTAKLAKQAGAWVVKAQRGRACQMNAGAEVAQGDFLCFVHADSRIPG